MPATKTKSEKATAFFHASYGQASIDAENGILRGVKLMEVGRLASFAGPDGKSKSITITPAHVSALLGHAGNRSIPIHLTHEWFNAQGTDSADSTELNARIGALKDFREDEIGNLIADAYLKAGRERENILWEAEHNPEDTMFSVVFSYHEADPLCIPISFRAGDIVPVGAATTALFTEKQNTTEDMTESEFIAMLSSPAVREAIAKLSAPTFTPADETAAAEMECEAGVTEADKKAEDDPKPALMRAVARIARASKRQVTEAAATLRKEIESEIGIKSEAAATAFLGKGGKFAVSFDKGGNDEVETLIAASIAAGAPNRATAIFRLAKDKPEIYNTARAAGKL